MPTYICTLKIQVLLQIKIQIEILGEVPEWPNGAPC